MGIHVLSMLSLLHLCDFKYTGGSLKISMEPLFKRAVILLDELLTQVTGFQLFTVKTLLTNKNTDFTCFYCELQNNRL